MTRKTTLRICRAECPENVKHCYHKVAHPETWDCDMPVDCCPVCEFAGGTVDEEDDE